MKVLRPLRFELASQNVHFKKIDLFVIAERIFFMVECNNE